MKHLICIEKKWKYKLGGYDMPRRFTFDNEINILEYFRDQKNPPLGLPENDGNLRIINSLYKDECWNSWSNSSGKDEMPPDFYNRNLSLMIEVMRVDDNASNNGSVNALKVKENEMLKELKETGILDKLSKGAKVTTLANTNLPTEEDHNFKRYKENFKRVIEKHSKKVDSYRKNHKGYKLIFFVFDESSGSYFEIPNVLNKEKIKFKSTVEAKLHFFWMDEDFINVIEKSKVDYLIWYKPYNSFKTPNGINDELPKVVIYDLSNMETQKIRYNENLMVSSEI